MTIPLRETAFAKYLRSIPREAAMSHLYGCLANGPGDHNLAWELWGEVHGERKVSGAELPEALGAMIDHLAKEAV